jgi:hypothetical protein
MVTVVLALPSTKPYLAAILLAALVIWLLVADLSTANSAAAVAAAVSAAPCIVRFVRYQLAASVPSPANPTMMERASAMITALAPLRSMRGPAASCHARWEIDTALRIVLTPLLKPRNFGLAAARNRHPTSGRRSNLSMGCLAASSRLL